MGRVVSFLGCPLNLKQAATPLSGSLHSADRKTSVPVETAQFEHSGTHTAASSAPFLLLCSTKASGGFAVDGLRFPWRSLQRKQFWDTKDVAALRRDFTRLLRTPHSGEWFFSFRSLLGKNLILGNQSFFSKFGRKKVVLNSFF